MPGRGQGFLIKKATPTLDATNSPLISSYYFLRRGQIFVVLPNFMVFQKVLPFVSKKAVILAVGYVPDAFAIP